jgi:hypothetical protein
MKNAWSLAELTEFDVRMNASQCAASPPPVTIGDKTASKSDVLKQWLHRSRAQDPEPARLASLAVQSEGWLRISLGIFSLLSGIGAAAALLRYEGHRLINISAFLGILVGGQLLSLLFLALSAFWLRHRLSRLQKLFLPKLVRALSSPQSIRAWRWRLFTSFQQAGMLFNLGVLLATLWKVLTADLAFGWETTLNVTGTGMNQIVQTLALPWGGHFVPDLQQIQQSRIDLKVGLAQLDTVSTASWWPFLMLCVLVYGLLPRLALSLFGSFRLHRHQHAPAFTGPDSERLYQRLTRTPLTFSSVDEKTSNGKTPASADPLPPLQPSGPLRLDLPPEIVSESQLPAFSKFIENRFGFSITESPNASAGILKVVEAWQPPLEETLRELRDLRETCGPDQDLLILAVGFPGDPETTFFKPPDPADLESWRLKLSTLNDPRLGLIPWEEASS